MEQWEQAELSGDGCCWALNNEVHLVSALKELPIYSEGIKSVYKVECDNVKRGVQNTILTSARGSGKL